MVRNYPIAMLCNWLKSLVAVFQSTRSKNKTTHALHPFPCYEQVVGNS